MQFVVAVEYVLRYHSDLASDGHEIGITTPPRHYMHVEVLLDSGTGTLPDIDADIEALGAERGSQAIYTIFSCLHKVPEGISVQAVEGRCMEIWNDHQMAVVVRILIHHNEDVRATVEYKVGPVIPLLRFQAKNTVFLFLSEDIFHAPGCPENFHDSLS